jgi:hypothetical protein
MRRTKYNDQKGDAVNKEAECRFVVPIKPLNGFVAFYGVTKGL